MITFRIVLLMRAQLEDAGTIVQVGFGAGSLSRPQFGLVKNLLWRGAATEQTQRDISSLLTYFWNRSKSLLPTEIVSDMEEFYSHHDLPRLDPDWPASAKSFGKLQFPASCGGHSYDRVPLAPGCAVLAERYAR